MKKGEMPEISACVMWTTRSFTPNICAQPLAFSHVGCCALFGSDLSMICSLGIRDYFSHLGHNLCGLGHNVIRSGLRLLQLLNIRSKLGLMRHDKIHLSFDFFVVHYEDLLPSVRECNEVSSYHQASDDGISSAHRLL